MEELPFSTGIQIIDAENISCGVDLVYVGEHAGKPDFDSMSLIEKAFQNLHG